MTEYLAEVCRMEKFFELKYGMPPALATTEEITVEDESSRLESAY
jgi:hypothetical protein